tara:strand:- start:148 stop:414 length:267 start_codon:yes stop_codon:yes gene_type:complete
MVRKNLVLASASPVVRDVQNAEEDPENPNLGGPENPSLRGASVDVVRVRNRASANPVLSVVVRDAQRERASSGAVVAKTEKINILNHV